MKENSYDHASGPKIIMLPLYSACLFNGVTDLFRGTNYSYILLFFSYEQ